jgi:hypothetical protein
MITRTSKRGYTVVKLEFIDARTEMINITANKDMMIAGENGASVNIKAGETFKAVRAGSLGPDMWYVVRQVSGEKKCSCPAMKPCKHEKLVASKAVAKVVAAMPVVEASAPTLEEIAEIVAEVEPLVAPKRKKVYSNTRCCEVWSDTREPVDPDAYDGAIADGLGISVAQLREEREKEDSEFAEQQAKEPAVVGYVGGYCMAPGLEEKLREIARVDALVASTSLTSERRQGWSLLK